MKRILVMLGISLLVVGGLLPLEADARGATSGRVQAMDQELIRDMQRQLKALGYNPGTVDGNFGAQTEAALRAYQQAYRLPTTGRLDEVTLRSLLPERSQTSRAPIDLSNREETLQAQRQQTSRTSIDLSNREETLQAQRQLKALGFNPGPADGNFGPQTEAALRAYQNTHRLPATGKLDEVTLRSLLLPGRFEESRAPIDLSNRELIRRAQVQLKYLGFDSGGVDGDFGPHTEAALRAYQHAYRLPETGRLDEVTVRSLLPEMQQGALR